MMLLPSANFIVGLAFTADSSIVIRVGTAVDVLSDNTAHLAVLPSTTPRTPHERAHMARTRVQRQARPVVRDNIDTLDHRPDDRVMKPTNWHRICQCQQERSDRGRRDSAFARGTSVAGITVLVIAGISLDAVGRGLAHAAAGGAPDGITLNVFDSLADLPHYSETLENQALPRAVAALRDAAMEADAAIVLTHYYGQIPAMVHNAIDWLTRRWSHSALNDKPLAIIGPTPDGYSGVWSRHQTEDSGRFGGTRVIEPFTATTLHQAVTRLAEQASMTNRRPSSIPVHNRSNGGRA
jgi:NAD(P)H-dependent FMN reductase